MEVESSAACEAGSPRSRSWYSLPFGFMSSGSGRMSVTSSGGRPHRSEKNVAALASVALRPTQVTEWSMSLRQRRSR